MSEGKFVDAVVPSTTTEPSGSGSTQSMVSSADECRDEAIRVPAQDRLTRIDHRQAASRLACDVNLTARGGRVHLRERTAQIGASS